MNKEKMILKEYTLFGTLIFAILLGTIIPCQAVERRSVDQKLFLGLYASDFSAPLMVQDTFPKNRRQVAEDNWETLFNGGNDENFKEKWSALESDTFPVYDWKIEEGTISLKEGGAIITREKYSNFKLVFDFKLTKGANSGIKYMVNRIENKRSKKELWNGLEYQIIDDYDSGSIKGYEGDIGSTGSLYLIYPPRNKKLEPAGHWNHGKIVVNGRHIEHWLNGIKVVSCERGSKDFRKRVSNTKFKVYDRYGESKSGYIMLTAHGDIVYFKNIYIQRL